jgi:hypothetical protein
MILTEVHLLESRVYRGIGNLSKSKVSPSGAIRVFSSCALTFAKCKGCPTSARTAANSIYCPPHLQAALELPPDPTIRSHLAALYDTLLQQNLLRIVEPYSVVEIDYVAKQVGQARQDVKAKCALNFLREE